MGWLTDNAEKFVAASQDPHGQPINPLFRSHAVQTRQVDELIGLVKGVLADGAICQGEVEFLMRWMDANRAAVNEWPARVIYPRIAEALSDGHMDPEEESEIMALLLGAVGGANLPSADAAATSFSSRLPLCDPKPEIVYGGQIFCFTGRFNSGTRSWCQEQVHMRGGVGADGIKKSLGYLVIGDIGSRDWLHSTHGLKIKKAIEYRESGLPLRIVSEEHWFDSLGQAA